jgi:general secretion pathway protein G
MKQFCDSAALHRQVRKTKASVPHSEAGLTLIEMMIVLVIIAVVAGTIVFSGILDRPDQARVTITRSGLTTVSGALKMYRLDNGNYPTAEQGLKALTEKPSTAPVPQSWTNGGYISAPALDAWGHPLSYDVTPEGFTLKSLGKDGKPGGEGMDADIELKG